MREFRAKGKLLHPSILPRNLPYIKGPENEIIEIDTTIPIEFEVQELEEENAEDFEEEDDELNAESFMKMQCENCKHYCPYCGKCSLGE